MLDTEKALRATVRKTALVTALVGGLTIGWGGFVPIESAIITSGLVVVENNVKKVQHSAGGLIGELNVVEGQRVKANDVLVRLDETTTRANLGVIMNELMAQKARMARLIAERDGGRAVVFGADVIEQAKRSPDTRDVMASETKLFTSRVASRNGQKAQLNERIGQTRQEIGGFEKQLASAQLQQKIAQDNRKRVQPLIDKKLISDQRIADMDRDIAARDGALGEIVSRISGARGKVTEVEVQIAQLDREQQTEVAKEMRDTETRIGELSEKRNAAEDQQRRVDVRSPIDGVVHQLNVHTVGGVVQPSETMMIIVPEDSPLIVEARINPVDINSVRVDHAARVRFTAFNQRTTPELDGQVYRVSRDVVKDQQTGQFYYTAAIRVRETEIARLKDLKLIPGMPADMFIKTGSRTFFEYISKSITDVIPHVFRET